MANFKKLDKVTTWARRHPDNFNMGDWGHCDDPEVTACGTSCCLAGTAILLEPGYELVWYKSADGWQVTSAKRPDGTTDVISDVAAEILDLSEDERAIFYRVRASIYELEEQIDGWRVEAKAEKKARK